MSPQQIEHELAQYSGTERYYASAFGWLQLTDGAHAVRELCQAYWLIDAIESYQAEPPMRDQEFQAWVLRKRQDGSAELVGEDGNGKVLVTQVIPYTDFPLPTITLWVENGVLLLPSEH